MHWLSKALLPVIACALSATAALAKPTEISIASGRPGGAYYPVAGAICTLINEHSAEHGVTCTVQLGVGSIDNIKSMLDGEATLAISQSDIQRDAVEGLGMFEKSGPATDMRSISALFVEQVTIATRRDKGIVSFEDLKGRRVYLGAPGTGSRVIMEQLMAGEGWAPGDVIDVAESSLAAPSLAEALCDAEVEAIVTTAGHPNPMIREATSMCDIVLVPLVGPNVDALIASEKLFAASHIPAGLYKGVGKEVPGIGLVATLVTTEDVPADVIYAVTKAVHEGFARLKKSSPLFGSLTAAQLSEDGLTAPLHEGAARYYDEIDAR